MLSVRLSISSSSSTLKGCPQKYGVYLLGYSLPFSSAGLVFKFCICHRATFFPYFYYNGGFRLPFGFNYFFQLRYFFKDSLCKG